MHHSQPSRRWILILFIYILGLTSQAVALTVVKPLPNGGFSAENDQLLVHIADGAVTNFVKLPPSGIADVRSGGVRMTQWVENIAYRRPDNTSGCSYFGGTFPLANWAVSWRQGPGDSAVFRQAAKFGPNLACSLIAEIYVTDQPTTIQVAGHTVALEPSQVKYSFDIDCPWQPLLAQSIGWPATTTNLTLIGRRAGPRLQVSVDTDTLLLTDLINPVTDMKPISLPDVPWMFFEEWRTKRCDLSTETINSSPPLHPVWPGFNFSDYSEIALHFGKEPLAYTTFNRFQGWAWSDNSNYTNVNVYVVPEDILGLIPELLSNGLFRYQMPLDVQLHMVDNTSYDPTISFLFGDFSSPDTSVAPADAQAAALASQTTIIVAVVVVGVVLIVVVTLVILVFRNQRFRQLVLPYTQRVPLNEQMSETAKSATPADRDPANWVPGRMSALKSQTSVL